MMQKKLLLLLRPRLTDVFGEYASAVWSLGSYSNDEICHYISFDRDTVRNRLTTEAERSKWLSRHVSLDNYSGRVGGDS